MNEIFVEKRLKSKIRIVNDKELNLESNSIIKNIADFFIIPILNLLPARSRNLIKKSNKAVNDIVKNVTKHDALDILYDKGLKHNLDSIFENIAHKIWFNTNNSKAVRNRLSIVKYNLRKSLESVLDYNNSINIVSIAAGSARAIIDAIDQVDTDKNINVFFVDKNPEALSYSKNIVKHKSIHEKKHLNFCWIEDTVNGFLDKNQIKFDIVEMVGLMDYFEDEKAKNIFNKIYESLNTGGYFITANINHNKEKKFVTKAIGWPMIYRSAEHIARLVNESNFTHDNMEIYYEPLKIHSIIIAKK